MRSLLGRSHWEADGSRDGVRSYVIEALGDPMGDETRFVKSYRRSMGVAGQYCGTAGRIEN
jgi:SRSO17 transposase